MYARYENGLSKMPIRHLLMLAKFYGVSTDYILGVEGYELDSGDEEDV
jgi:transcriptional regulator with XRE-family HTH domain